MKFLSAPALSGSSDCPYLENRTYRQEYFFGTDANPEQFQVLLDNRFRRFGVVFFRPVCPECQRCIPIRVDVGRFVPTASQKRVLRKNRETTVLFSELKYRPEMYAVYEKHSRIKFGQDTTEDEFYRNFFQPGVPSFQSEFYAGDVLIGFGILDSASSGLSTVYFSYDPDYSALSPGTFSILSEIEETRRRGLKYYYSGYYIEECSRMTYKGKFHPYELLINGVWTKEEDL
jgi:leucyl-tRNA---protein transferase